MRSVENRARWNEALRGEHQVLSTATLLRPGIEPVVLPGLEDGTVTLDQKADIRGTLDCQFVDDGSMNLVPEDPSSLLAPYGQEIQIHRGIVLPDGYQQTVSLGIFRIQDASSNEAGDGSLIININGFDRGKRVEEAKLLHRLMISRDDFQIPTGTDYLTAIRESILAGDPSAVFNFVAFTGTAPLITEEEGGDRWQIVKDMAAAIGMDLYLDGDGLYTLRPIPVIGPTTEPVAEYVEGEDGLLTSANSDWTREGGFNGFIYTGENSDVSGAPPRGEAFDMNPLSPTFWDGTYGQVPDFQTSSLLTTDAQAKQAADGRLAKELGTSRSISFGGIVDPSLEPTDIIKLKRERLHINEFHIIDQLTIPLAADALMAGQTRSAIVSG